MASQIPKPPKSDMLPVLTFEEKSEESGEKKCESLQCLQCEKCWSFPEGKDDYLAHLFLEHRLVISDVDDIGILEDYLQFWQNEFKGCELEQYCSTMLLDQSPDGQPSKNEKYYLLSDIVPKDFEIRKRLEEKRLQQVLAQHQFERTDRNFSKECLFCRNVIKGLRADYVRHLYDSHFVQLGKPENLVFIDQLISKVQYNMEHFICLFCEKVFKNRITLKEHMRKKGHKLINEKNTFYDKFFLQNYRQEKVKPFRKNFHKKNQTPEARRKHQKANKDKSTPTIRPQSPIPISPKSPDDFEHRVTLNSDDTDSDWSDWDDQQSPPLHCLYCTKKVDTFNDFKQHLIDTHQVDFEAGIKGLHFYQRVKVVNYVRRQVCLHICVSCELRFESQEELLNHMKAAQHFGLGTKSQWDRPEYFFPTYEDDGLLCILDDNPNDDMDDTVVRIISEDPLAKVNKDAEQLSLEGIQLP